MTFARQDYQPPTDTLSKLKVKPLVWRDESGDDFRLFSAESDFGRFVYGTDRTGQPYRQDPAGEIDHVTEVEARTASEALYTRMVLDRIGTLTIPNTTAAASHEALSVIREFAAILAKYVSECREAKEWGGPTIMPRHPIDEASASRLARALSQIV